MPEKKEKQITGKVKFRLKVALTETELNEDFLITAPGNQPIIEALQGDTRLDKIKKKLPRIYLYPYGENNPIRGVPNIGSPCSLIEGGRFEARLGKVQNPNKNSEDELGLSGRHKIYLDARDRRYKAKWLTKEHPNTFDSPILVDCLPSDTLLLALLRDERIKRDWVRYAELICKDSTGEINTKLTDECRSHDGKTFACRVHPKTLQVSDKEWGEVIAQLDNSPDVAISGTRGDLDLQAEIAKSGEGSETESLQTEWLVIQHRSKSQVAELLKLDLEEKDSPMSEGKRKKKLDRFVKPYRHDFCSANPGIRISLMEKCCELGRSVGVLKKNDHRYGTCLRLGSKFVLTNRHVTEEMAKVGGESFVEFNYKSLNDPDLFEFKVKRVVCTSQNNESDHSLLELDVPDDQSERLPPGLGHLIASSSKAKLVTIIGHPGGRPQEANICCPIVGSDHKNIKAIAVYLNFNPEPTGGANYRMVDDPGRVTYRSVFGPGSSGSPGFDEEGKLIVMHTCGYPLYKGSSSLVEQGVKMTAIRDDLEQYDHGLSAELFPTESMETD
ncbi:uncharacterized protein LOC118429238 [Branchiostoma floridae]|nr:uncharacterized protein LOC118429238 [Branchiostoma floridae]